MPETNRIVIPNGDGVFWQYPVIAIQNTPPVEPDIGDCYIVGASGTGAWEHLEDSIVYWYGDEWVEQVPNDPTVVFLKSLGTTYKYVNGGWVDDDLGRINIVTQLADDGTYELPINVAGWGFVMIGDSQEYAQFTFTKGGDVFIDVSSSNVENSNMDGNLCIYDGGSGVVIKNRLGSSLTMAINVNYYFPA